MIVSKSFTFSVFIITSSGVAVNYNLINSISEELKEPFQIEGEIVSLDIVRKIKVDNRFIGFAFMAGSRYPYVENVIDLDSSDFVEDKNPKPINKVELEHTLFVLFDTKSSRVYISDIKQLNTFIEWLIKSGIEDVSCKPIIDKEDFLKSISRIDNINMVSEPNLFNNSGSTLDDFLKEDAYGYDPDKIELKLSFNAKKPIGSILTKKIDSLIKKQSNYKKITIQGRTANNFLAVFNGDEVLTKLPIKVDIDSSTGTLSEKEVLFELSDRIIKEVNI